MGCPAPLDALGGGFTMSYLPGVDLPTAVTGVDTPDGLWRVLRPAVDRVVELHRSGPAVSSTPELALETAAHYVRTPEFGVQHADEALRAALLAPTHGDLGPWNVRCDPRDGTARVLDFEDYRATGIAAMDIVNLLMTTALVVFPDYRERGFDWLYDQVFDREHWFGSVLARGLDHYGAHTGQQPGRVLDLLPFTCQWLIERIEAEGRDTSRSSTAPSASATSNDAQRSTGATMSDTNATPVRTDAVVIGGGPAGLFAALTLVRAGRRVALLEAGGDMRESLCSRLVARMDGRSVRDAEKFRLQCPRCTCLTGLGGAAFHFDTNLGYISSLTRSKIESAPDGTVRSYSGLERALGSFEHAQELISEAYRIFYELGLPPAEPVHAGQDDSFGAMFQHVDTAFSQSVTVDDSLVVIARLNAELEENGGRVLLHHRAEDIEPLGGGGFEVRAATPGGRPLSTPMTSWWAWASSACRGCANSSAGSVCATGPAAASISACAWRRGGRTSTACWTAATTRSCPSSTRRATPCGRSASARAAGSCSTASWTPSPWTGSTASTSPPASPTWVFSPPSTCRRGPTAPSTPPRSRPGSRPTAEAFRSCPRWTSWRSALPRRGR
ncbi:FAD-binding protein [Streptomyces indonesiensis]